MSTCTRRDFAGMWEKWAGCADCMDWPARPAKPQNTWQLPDTNRPRRPFCAIRQSFAELLRVQAVAEERRRTGMSILSFHGDRKKHPDFLPTTAGGLRLGGEGIVSSCLTKRVP
ncbi:MAG: hypothetical protein RL215_495 [Planctomycetota bacterium]